jgi:hypothetical protein
VLDDVDPPLTNYASGRRVKVAVTDAAVDPPARKPDFAGDIDQWQRKRQEADGVGGPL